MARDFAKKKREPAHRAPANRSRSPNKHRSSPKSKPKSKPESRRKGRQNRRTPLPVEKSSKPIGLWLIAAVLIVSLAAFLVYLLKSQPSNGVDVITSPVTDSRVDNPATAVKKSRVGMSLEVNKPGAKPELKLSLTDKGEAKVDDKMVYEFYKLLQESEVKVDVVQLDQQKGRTKYIYYIQAGSFKSRADASFHSKRLIRQKLKAHIEGPSKGGWYRVLVGPYYKDAGVFSKERAALVNQGFDTMKIKRVMPKVKPKVKAKPKPPVKAGATLQVEAD